MSPYNNINIHTEPTRRTSSSIRINSRTSLRKLINRALAQHQIIKNIRMLNKMATSITIINILKKLIQAVKQQQCSSLTHRTETTTTTRDVESRFGSVLQCAQ